MIIESITLNNIRSYKSPSPIQLTTGITLFEGDIGSGKSTILSAIEFALFGLGDIDGAYLLRHGERTGSVLLEFTVDSRKYKIYRSLERKRKSITQKEGYIVEDGLRTDYSVSEMKTRILEILNFNERPRPKTSSLIFRYAIFTPQEMMKEVLFQPVERRLETLRRAFRIEDYSTIVNNTSIMLSWLDTETKILRRQTQNITEKRSELDEENKRTIEYKAELETLLRKLQAIKDEQQRIFGELENLQERKEIVQRLQIEIPHLEQEITEKNTLTNETLERIGKLEQELKEIKEAEQRLATIEPEYGDYISSKTQLDQMEPSVKAFQELSKDKEKLEAAIGHKKQLLENEIKRITKDITTLQEKISKQKPATLEISSIERETTELESEVENLTTISKMLVTLKQNYSAISQEIKSKRERQEQMNAELYELKSIGIGAPCPKCKQELTEQHYQAVHQDYLGELQEVANKIGELDQKKLELNSEINKTEDEERSLKEKQKKLAENKESLATLRTQAKSIVESEGELTEKEALIEKNSKALDEQDYAKEEREKLALANSELEKLLPIQAEYEEIKAKVKDFEKAKIEEKYHTNKGKIDRKDEVTRELAQDQSRLESLKGEIFEKKNQLEEKRTIFEQEKDVLQTIKQLEEEKKDLDGKREEKAAEIAGKKKEIENSEGAAKRLEEEIRAKEEQLLELDELKQYALWLSELFIPAMKLIESHVMASINSEFNSLFQKWLSYLLETGDISVRVDDNFTPIIELNGYEMDVGSLSGGEKTSVALAYRLALNVMVKKVCEAMQSNLLILDEPTDGFSREQLFRLRDILNELKCEQVIAVSHESELEGFVDKIYRITKEAGVSKICVE